MKAFLMVSVVALFLLSGIIGTDGLETSVRTGEVRTQSSTTEDILSELLEIEHELSRLAVLLEHAFCEVDRIYDDNLQITDETDNIMRVVLAELEQNSPAAWSGALPPIQESATRIDGLIQRMREKNDLVYYVRDACVTTEELQRRAAKLIDTLEGAE